MALCATLGAPKLAGAPPSSARYAGFSEWKVTVTGGPFAGSYELSSMTPCSKDNPAKGMLAMGYDRGVDSAFAKEKAPIRKALNDPKSLNWAELYADAASGTGKLTVYFGKLTEEDGPSAKRGTRYEVETRSGRKVKGSGKFTVKPNGGGAVIAFDGRSAQGVKLGVRVTCERFF
jgi:hypothetical protein